MIPHKQLSLAEFFSNCQEKFENDKPQFLSLLENTITINKFIPLSFRHNFYTSTGRPRKYTLNAMIWALILQRIFSIPTDSFLIIFLKYSKELREFCGFNKVPDASKITRFKQDFVSDLQSKFDNLVDITEPICQQIDEFKASMTIFDTSGIEAYVTKNNPKFVNRIISQLKSYKKAMNLDNSYDPYKAAYGSMPSHASSNQEIKQLYINGHFCYVYKFGIVTNGLGIARDISFYNKDFLNAHPDIFVGDAAFDSSLIYKSLLQDIKFSKAYIPLNSRSTLKYEECTINEDGIPCCPHDHSLLMKPEGSCKRKNGLVRYKFSCPKVKFVKQENKKYKRQCYCENPCTTSSSGRIFYVYPEKDLRAYPGTIRGTSEWEETYKIRSVVEQSINHFKESFCIAGRKTKNEKTLHADLLLAGITQLITVVLADKIHKHQYNRSLKPLIT